MIVVECGDPRDPQASALLRESHALMESLFPPEDNFFLDIDALTAPHIRFFTARAGDAILGTGALAIQKGYGELKSMFVAPAERGKGVADALMRALEDEARTESLPILRLETGNVLHAAHRLYARHGFTPCGPFGGYQDARSSVFMEKTLCA